MDLAKQSEYFNPINVTDEIHIIGLGAIGSTLLISIYMIWYSRSKEFSKSKLLYIRFK